MRLATLILLAVGLLAGACNSGDSAAPAEDSAFLELLRLVPDRPEYRSFLFMGDLKRAAEMLDVQRPSGAYDEAAVLQFAQEVAQPKRRGFDGVMPGFFNTAGADDLHFSALAERSLGFSLVDVEQWVATQNPPEEIAAIRGAFDTSAIKANIESCSECPPADVGEHRGWAIYAWGSESAVNLEQAFQPPLHDDWAARGGSGSRRSSSFARTPPIPSARWLMRTRVMVHSRAWSRLHSQSKHSTG